MKIWDRNTPWRQGHLFKKTDAEILGFSHLENPEKTLALIISHDCDLAQGVEKEPNAELIVGHVVTEPDGNYSYAKTARILEINFAGDTFTRGRFCATNRKNISKDQLASYSPDESFVLEKNQLKILQRWLAARYSRPAFPDEFDRQLKSKKIDEQLQKLSRKHGQNVVMVLFDLRDEVAGVFPLGIQLVYTSNPDSEEQATAMAEAITSLFEERFFDESEQWQCVELLYCDAILEDELTYSGYARFQRWNLDAISFAADPEQALPKD